MKFISRTAYVVAIAHIIIELFNNFLPVMYPLLIANMGLPYTYIGFIALAASFAATLSQPLFGIISDRWKPNLIIVLSILWAGVIMGLVGFAWNYASLLVLVVLGGLGVAAFHPPGAAMASAGGGSRKGAAVSVFSVGGNLGAALSPLLIGAAILLLGMNSTIIFIPIAVIAAAILFWQFRKSDIPDNQPSQQQTKTHTTRSSMAQSSILSLMLVILIVMCRSWFHLSIATYLPEWMHSQGWSLTAGGQILAVMLVSVSVGSLLGGTMSDRFGRWQVVAASMVLMIPSLWLFLSTSGWTQAGLIAPIGVLIGASFPVTIVMAQEAWPGGVGLASSLVIGLAWTPGGIGASITGYIADQSSLAVGLQWLIIMPLLGVGFALAYAAVQQRAVPQKVVNY